jgi:hypothetical protein
MFSFPGDEGYEGHEYERLRCKYCASNATGLVNMLGPNEVKEDLQQMNGAQVDRGKYEEESKNNEDEEEKDKGTNTQRLTIRCQRKLTRTRRDK